MTDDAGGAPTIDPGKADAAIRFSFVQQGVAGGGQRPPTPLGIDDVGGDNPSRTYHFNVGSDRKIYGAGDALPEGPAFPMTMTLRVMQGVIDVHSKIFRPDELVPNASRWDSGSSIVHADLPSDQGKGFGSDLRNEHRFMQFVPLEGDYLSAVRANIVNNQSRGFLFQFRVPDEPAAVPMLRLNVDDGQEEDQSTGGEGRSGWSFPSARRGCVLALLSFGALGALVAALLVYAFWDTSDDGSSQVVIPSAGQNAPPAPPPTPLPLVFSGFPDLKNLLDRLGFDSPSERQLDANLTTLQPHSLFYSDSSKQPGLDANWLKIRAYTGGYVSVPVSWSNTLNQRFSCGSVVDGARTTCAAGVTGFSPTDYWIGATVLFDKIPASDPSISSTFGFVAGDPSPANNFKASPPFDKDLYNQTKYWYEFGHVVATDQWSLRLRVYPQTASPAPSGAIVVNSGDTIFWAIPEKELPAGDLHFNVTTFGYTALPPNPATAAVDALSDPRNPLPLAPRTMISVGSSQGYPNNVPAGDLTSSFQTYLNDFADKFRVRDNAYLFDHLDPAVVQVYSADQCRASLAPRKPDPTFKIVVTAVTGPAPFNYQAEGKTVVVPAVYTVVSQVTAGGSAAEQTQHFTYDSGKLTWFTMCSTAGP